MPNSIRIAVGLAVAAVLAAIGQAQAECPTLMWGLFVAAFVIIAITAAPWTPVLRKAPVIGAPRFRATLETLNGLDTRVAHLPASDGTRSAELQLKFVWTGRSGIDAANISVIVPRGELVATPVAPNGQPTDGWSHWEVATDTLVSSNGLRLPSKSSTKQISVLAGGDTIGLNLKLEHAEPGEYPIRVKVTHDALSGHDLVFNKTVCFARSAEMSETDMASDAIDELERQRTEWVNASGGLMAAGILARQAVPESKWQVFKDIPFRFVGDESGPEYGAARIDHYIACLYRYRRGDSA